EAPLRVPDADQVLRDVRGEPDRAAVPLDRLRDRLADPPGRIGREPAAAVVVESVDRLDQADRTLLDQIGEREPLTAVAPRGGRDEAEVGLDHPLPGARVAGPDPSHERLLLGGAEARGSRALVLTRLRSSRARPPPSSA